MSSLSDSDFRTRSYWLGSSDHEPRSRLPGDRRFDLVVIGGGFTGLAAAYYTKRAEPGLDIAVLEADVVGYGASGRNAGFCMPIEGWQLAACRLFAGRERAREILEFSHECVRGARELIEREGIDCDFEPVGMLEIGRNALQMAVIRHEVELFHDLGHTSTELLDAHALRDHIVGTDFLGARLEPDSPLLNPAKLARGLAISAEALGVSIFEQTPVTRITPGPTVDLATPTGHVRADRVVVATNAYSQPFRIQHDKFAPMFTYIILTDPLSDCQLAELGWTGHEGVVDKRLMIHYLRLTADNRLLFGGRDAPYFYGNAVRGHDANEAVFGKLEHGMHQMFPVTRRVPISHRRGP